MANNFQQYNANQNAGENKLTAHFQEVLSLLQSANSIQCTNAPPNENYQFKQQWKKS